MRSAPKVAAPAKPSGFRIAVLPFKCGTSDADMLALADGLSEEIVSGLSRFRYLSVVANASADGARYVVEGSLRRGGSDLRVTAQLVDAQTGARLWSETYRRDLQASGLFAVQDDVAGRVVATVADSYGVLLHSIRAAGGQKDDADLTPVEWQFQYFAYREQITPASYAALKSRLERALERNDRQSEVWACLAQIYVDEYAFGFASDATSLDRALAAARRAVELDRANQFAMVALAQVHFFRQDLAAFGPAAERAMALNPLNTDAVGILGLQIVHTGEFERGAAIVRRAMELNPNHAGWMHFAPLWEHFHKAEYEQALERAEPRGRARPLLAVSRRCVGLWLSRPACRGRVRGPGPPGARSRLCGARTLERPDLALRERPHGAHPRRAAQGGALDSRDRRIDRLTGAGRDDNGKGRSCGIGLALATCPSRGGFLDRRAAVQVRRCRHLPHDPG